MNQPFKIPAVKPVCTCDALDWCDACYHSRCEYCNRVGQRMAQEFEHPCHGNGPASIIFYECPNRKCQLQASRDFDRGKEGDL
jgi:hypothetical protein